MWQPEQQAVLRVAPVVALLVALLGWLSPGDLVAQSERPKIGLVLSGGGAKGAAHIGVLKVLEELHVPIDYVAGTSMGAIIGGLYASGMSVEELEREVSSIDWGDVLNDKPNRTDLAFRRKEDTTLFLIPLEGGIGKGGLKWPPGLIQGQKLYFLLQSLTLPVAHVEDFAQLPVPFRCVATDINSGDVVVLERGNLAASLRASMAIPTFFSPVELDGRLLVDGGLVQNLPVDVAHDMGADIVIAVDVGDPLEGQTVESLLQVYSQTMRLMTRVNTDAQMAKADIALSPPILGIGTMDFSDVGRIVELGVETARAATEALSRYAVSAGEYERLMELRPQPREAPSTIGDVRFEGNERVDDRVIEPLLRMEAGDPLDLDALSEDMQRIYGLMSFESVSFSLSPGEQPDLTLHLREKPWGPNYLNFSLGFSSDFDGDTDFGLLTSITSRPLNHLGAEWRNTLVLGRESGVATSFYQPLNFRGRWFIEPRIEFRNRRPFYYEDLRRRAELDLLDGIASLDFGHQFSKFGELRLGVRRGGLDGSVESGELPEDVLEQLDGGVDIAGAAFRGVLDRLDSAVFPTRGGSVVVQAFYSLESLGADDDYAKWESRLNRFVTIADRHTILVSAEGGWSPGGELPVYEEFTLGGFLSLSGFARDQLRGQTYGVGRLGYYARVHNFYLGGYAEAGNTWETSAAAGFDDLIGTGTLFLGKNTALGPVYLAYGVAEGGHSSLYIVFGRTF